MIYLAPYAGKSVKRSDVTRNPLEWLQGENNVIWVPLPHTSKSRLLSYTKSELFRVWCNLAVTFVCLWQVISYSCLPLHCSMWLTTRTPLWNSSFKEAKCFFPAQSRRFKIVRSLRDREVASPVSDRQGSNFESCIWRAVPSQSSHYSHEVLLAQFSLYVHKGRLKPHSFHSIYVLYIAVCGDLRPFYSQLYKQCSSIILALIDNAYCFFYVTEYSWDMTPPGCSTAA